MLSLFKCSKLNWSHIKQQQHSSRNFWCSRFLDGDKTPSKAVIYRLPFVSDEIDHFHTIRKFRGGADKYSCLSIFCAGGYYIPDLGMLAFGPDQYLLIPRPGNEGPNKMSWRCMWWSWNPPPITTVPWHPILGKRNPRLCFLPGEVSKGAWPGWTCQQRYREWDVQQALFKLERLFSDLSACLGSKQLIIMCKRSASAALCVKIRLDLNKKYTIAPHFL